MKPSLHRDTNTITIANFWENYLLNKYDFEPPYQRNSIWSDEKQSFLIDSILRNFPIPPIFLHQRIDNATGKTTYEVIDGKQRLTSLVRFIQNEIPCSSESADAGTEEDEIAGKFFRDLDNPELIEFKHHFWRYSVPIEYIDTTDPKLIDNIFDRLNRNGEPLRGQELRNAKYHDTRLLNLVREKSELPFWKDRLETVDKARMEHREFISEAIFVILEKGPLHANQDEIDRLYKKYTEIEWNSTAAGNTFDQTTAFLQALRVDFDKYKLRGVSHLYGLWCFSFHCVSNNITIGDLPAKLDAFYAALRSGTSTDPNVQDYSNSMSSRTKDRGQRIKRVNGICGYCGLPSIPG